jgi:hypothetical protein
MSLDLHLKILGILFMMFTLLHVFLPKRLNWSEELPRLSLLNRQIFLVHTFFIALVLMLFGALTFFFTDALLERTTMARAILAGFVAFWSARWIVQVFVYDRRLWRGHRFNMAVHIVLVCFWTYCVVTYGWALVVAWR